MAKTVSPPLVELTGASLRVGERLLFRNTNWIFRRGEQWALVGPNGSGKTLFASALTGAIPVVRGEFRVPDGAVAHVSFEQQKLFPGNAPAAARWFSLEEDAAPPVRQFLSQDSVEDINPFEIVLRSQAAARTFAQHQRRVVRLLGIAPLLEQPVPSLSNGEMRKVLLARALLRQPQLLILDDPFSGLDVRFRRHLKEILEKLMRHGAVHLLLIATHPDELPRGITHLLRVGKVPGRGTRSVHKAARTRIVDGSARVSRAGVTLSENDHSQNGWASSTRAGPPDRRDRAVRCTDDLGEHQLGCPSRRELGVARAERVGQEHLTEFDHRRQPAGLRQ